MGPKYQEDYFLSYPLPKAVFSSQIPNKLRGTVVVVEQPDIELLPVRLLNPLRTRSSVHLEGPTVQIELAKSGPYGDAFRRELLLPERGKSLLHAGDVQIVSDIGTLRGCLRSNPRVGWRGAPLALLPLDKLMI
jgi:hypothetical protein